MHITFRDFKPLTFCGNEIGFGGDVSVYQKPYAIELTKGKHNLKTCKQCKGHLAELTKRFTDSFDGKLEQAPFPHCCIHHTNLLNDKRFDRIDFVKVPEQTARKIMYAYHHAINHINEADWKENIIDYIEYAQWSFGQFPDGCGQPIFANHFPHYLCGFIETCKEIPEEKKAFLLGYLKTKPKAVNDNDLQILLSTYEKWIMLFPFDVSDFFSNLKSLFEKNLPFVKPDTMRKNRYTGMVVIELCKQQDLVAQLFERTKGILSKVNSKELYTKGLIADKEKHRVNLVNETHRLKQSTLLKNYSIGEIQYADLLNNWLQNEKEYFAEIEPSIKQNATQPKEEKTQKRNYTAYAMYYYYLQSIGAIEWFDNWDGGRQTAYKEVVKKHYDNSAQTAWKQFQTEYVKFEQENSSNRWQLCSKENYRAVIELLKDNPKALEKAKAELSKAIE